MSKKKSASDQKAIVKRPKPGRGNLTPEARAKGQRASKMAREQKEAAFQAIVEGRGDLVVLVPGLEDVDVVKAKRMSVAIDDARLHAPSPLKLLRLLDSAAMEWWQPSPAQIKALELQARLFGMDNSLRISREKNKTISEALTMITDILKGSK